MFQNLSLLIFLSLFAQILFAQPKVTKETYQNWNRSTSQWDYTQVNSWKYDDQGNEILRLEERYSPGREGPDSYSSAQYSYDQHGNLDWHQIEEGADSTVKINQTKYHYDGLQRLSEVRETFMMVWPDSSSGFNPYHRKAYFYVGNNKTSVKTFFSIGDPPGETLDTYIDTLYDINGCVAQIYRRFYRQSDLTPYLIAKDEYTRDDRCRILTEISSTKSKSDFSFVRYRKVIYEYAQGKKPTHEIYQDYSRADGKWVTKWVYKYIYDPEFREIDFQYSYIPSTGIPVVLDRTTHEYDGAGRLLSIKNYYRNAFISARWHYYKFDHEGNMIQQKIKSRTFGTGFTQIVTEHYTYYCDGQLKSKTIDNLPSVSRVLYEYENGGDCSLQNQEPEISIFPNPSTGHFEIESPMLLSPNVVVNIFSPIGRAVYTENLTQYTDRKLFDLSHLPLGTYYLTLQDGKQSVSKQILIRY